MKRKKLSLSVLCMLLLCTFAIMLHASQTTIKEDKLESFCIKNSEISSESFSHFEFDEYPNYSFWVSSDKKITIIRNFLFLKRTVSFKIECIFISKHHQAIATLSEILFCPKYTGPLKIAISRFSYTILQILNILQNIL